MCSVYSKYSVSKKYQHQPFIYGDCKKHEAVSDTSSMFMLLLILE